MLSSFAVIHSFLWSQLSQIINVTQINPAKSQEKNLSGMFLQGFCCRAFVTPDACVINVAGES